MNTRFEKLLKELSKKKLELVDVSVVIAWMTEAYNCGLRDAGDLLGEEISKNINKAFAVSGESEQ